MIKVGYLEFDSNALCDQFIEQVGKYHKEPMSCNTVLTCKPALTAFNLARDWALRTAADLLRGVSGGREVRVDTKTRQVLVAEVPSFKQTPTQTRGAFSIEFAELKLPN